MATLIKTKPNFHGISWSKGLFTSKVIYIFSLTSFVFDTPRKIFAFYRFVYVGVFSIFVSLASSAGALLSALITGRICRRQLCRYCFTHGPIFGFYAPQGRHVAPINVKFGMVERTVRAKFHLDRFRVGGLQPPKLKKMEFYQYNCP